MEPNTYSDEQLSAWVDGELDAAEHARIGAWLAEHPEQAARTRQWAADRDALRAGLEGLLDEPLPAALRRQVLGASTSRYWARAAMVAGLLFTGGAIGALLTWQWLPRVSPSVAAGSNSGWVQRAVLAHGVYVPEPRHAVEVKAQEEHLARWLTRRIDVPVKLFDLRDQGFELVGGRLLPDGRGKSAQLMYQDAMGLRITVYLRKPDPGTDAAFRYERQGEVGMFYWVEAGAGYALVGALPRARLLALAESIYRQHPPPMAAASALR